MSVKRQATTDLNHENWDQDDPSEDNTMGHFQAAPKEVLEKRVMRTAKRRTQGSNEPNKSVFSGFGGFNKTQPSSFDFLANLTNGSKKTNGSTAATSGDTSVTSSLFSNKPTGASGGLFGVAVSSTSKTLPSTISTTSPFGAAVKTSTSPSTLFTATKADSTVNDSLKMQSVSSSADDKTKITSPAPPSSTNVFGDSSATESKSLFSTSNSTLFKTQPVSSTTAMVQTSFGTPTKTENTSNTPEKKVEDKVNEKKMKYYAKLKGLNQSVSDWISKHVVQTPLCILSPIFKDYEKYLKEITEEYQGADKDESDKKGDSNADVKSDDDTKKRALLGGSNNTGSPFGNTSAKPVFGGQNLPATGENKPTFSFGIKTPATSSMTATSTGFSFGVTTSTVASVTTTTASGTGFSFGTTTSPVASATITPASGTGFSFGTTASPVASATTTTASGTGFSFGTNSSPVASVSPFTGTTNTSTNQSSGAPFSFGIGKPFSFSSNNVQQSSAEPANTENDEDEPPKVEYTPVKEDNSVYEKKCKIFVKKDSTFADKGVGTLYVKKIEESGKHQLLVRANTSLGTVLLNLVLASAVPIQRMGKNNVMLVCIPTPDAKPPPTPVLIRVKTGEEADELLETLTKYKA